MDGAELLMKKSTVVAKFRQIKIQGTDKFVDSAIRSMKLLEQSRSFNTIIEPNVQTILFQTKRSRFGNQVGEARPGGPTKTIFIFSSEIFAEDKIQDFACLLAHEAYHYYRHSRFMKFGNRRLWTLHRRCSRNRDEFYCTKFEARIAKELGFRSDLIEWKDNLACVIPHKLLPRKQVKIVNYLRRQSMKMA